jgi:uncharacterized membrane-anchored protein YitT (DUF2179 family)
VAVAAPCIWVRPQKSVHYTNGSVASLFSQSGMYTQWSVDCQIVTSNVILINQKGNKKCRPVLFKKKKTMEIKEMVAAGFRNDLTDKRPKKS